MGENNSRLKPLLPIGIFDSGIGGLSVLQAIQALLPAQPTIYLGDQVHVPYGSRPLEQVRAFSEEITRFLLNRVPGSSWWPVIQLRRQLCIILRMTFPNTPFVGMEPAVKPAAENTLTGVVGVLATPATFQSELYASVVERFAQGVKVLQNTCPGLVDQIEKGKLDDAVTMQILHKAIDPMLEQNVDTIVMGCTHYPFVIPQIRQIAGDFGQGDRSGSGDCQAGGQVTSGTRLAGRQKYRHTEQLLHHRQQRENAGAGGILMQPNGASGKNYVGKRAVRKVVEVDIPVYISAG